MKITSSGTNNGWNLTVNGNASAGKSAVFKQYCPSATCGTDTGPRYVSGGFTLPADSLTLNTSGASWTSAAPRPAYQCSSSPFCKIDHATATKVVSASASVALGTWTGSGTSVLTLATPASLRKLQTGEVYRVDVVWTLSSGP
jgi:cytidylate kinase